MQAGCGIEPDACVMTCGNFFCTQAHGMVEKRFELDLCIAQDVRIGCASRLVLAHKLGKHAVFVIGRKVDMLDFYAQHIGHGSGIHEVDVGCAELAVIIVFPVFHEDADHLIALRFEQMSGHCRVHAAGESDDDTLLGHRPNYP